MKLFKFTVQVYLETDTDVDVKKMGDRLQRVIHDKGRMVIPAEAVGHAFYSSSFVAPSSKFLAAKEEGSTVILTFRSKV